MLEQVCQDQDMRPEAQRRFPALLQVETTTRCNMRCAMCVKSASGCRIPETHMPMELFAKIESALPHCKGLVLNGIGEPLMHPQLPEMAAFAREHLPQDAWMGFQSNGLLLTPRLAGQLVQAGVDTVCLSVDAVTPGNDRKELHGQQHVSRLEEAFAMLADAGKQANLALRLGVEFVLMADNWRQLPAVVDWAARQGAQFVIVSHALAYDAAMAGQSLFNPNTPKATAIFEEWQARAQEEGLDFHNFLNVLWKFHKNPQEKRLVELVQEMQDDAQRRGVWIHLRHLLEWDKRSQASLQAAFEESRRLADAGGMEVHLPPLLASDERRCHFLEQDAAFVTVEGNVAPCQFLWHEIACHMDGEAKHIKPWHFGNIGRTPLESIWAADPYADFRREVLQYEYPYCSNCSFVPCDDIAGIYPFENDCLGHTIPCGHCLWCMGGLQCLL